MAQLFPKWTNKVPLALLSLLVVGVSFIVFVFWYWFSPLNLEVGYEPVQPVPYSHQLHAGDLGIDCRYCHNAESSPQAGVPPTERCMNCHSQVKTNSVKLAPVIESWKTNMPIPWVRVTKLPDYVYFDHRPHLAAGVGCISCHGRIDQMERVRVVKPLSMGWCLDCHRDPAAHLRPLDKVTDMEFKPTEEWLQIAKMKAASLHPPVESCSGCHR